MLRLVATFISLLVWASVTCAKEKISPTPHIVALASKHAYKDFPRQEDILAVIHVESKFKPKARGYGGRGLMQVKGGSFNPEKNIIQGTEYLREMFLKYRSEKKAFMAYNLGPGNLDRRHNLRKGIVYFKRVTVAKGLYKVEEVEPTEVQLVAEIDP